MLEVVHNVCCFDSCHFPGSTRYFVMIEFFHAEIPWTGAKRDIIHMFDVVSKKIP